MTLGRCPLSFFCSGGTPESTISCIKNELTGLCGNRLLHNDCMNTLCERKSMVKDSVFARPTSGTFSRIQGLWLSGDLATSLSDTMYLVISFRKSTPILTFGQMSVITSWHLDSMHICKTAAEEF